MNELFLCLKLCYDKVYLQVGIPFNALTTTVGKGFRRLNFLHHQYKGVNFFLPKGIVEGRMSADFWKKCPVTRTVLDATAVGIENPANVTDHSNMLTRDVRP